MNAGTQVELSNTTRRRLLLGAERLVITKGVHALSVRRIAAEAGVNSALIRYYFGNVDALLRELARLNAARIDDSRGALLAALAARGVPDFEGAVDALVLPLWAGAAMSPDQRAIVVLDEIFSRAGEALHREVWAMFSDKVRQVAQALAACLPDVSETALAWRIRFVTAAALDVPPRATRGPARPIYGRDDPEERLAQFRAFAQQALRMG